jgi:hypothetical protein
MRDAHDALFLALVKRMGEVQQLEVREARSEDWASATFSGSRHSYALTLFGPSAAASVARLTEGLDAMEFHLPGHLVADIAVANRADGLDYSTLTIEALTVEDR